MQNYIIITIIIAVIIIFLYKKNNNFEHFDNQILNLESLQNVFSTFVNRDTVSFNNIVAESVNTTTLNENYVVGIDLSSNVTHGDVLRYNEKNKIWQNYKTVYPHFLYLNIFLTLDFIQGVGGLPNYAENLLLPSQYESSFDRNNYSFPQDGKPHTSNVYHSEYGLNFNRISKMGFGGPRLVDPNIKNFDPKKTYKIDCTLYLQNLYRRSSHGNRNRIYLSIRDMANKTVVIAQTMVSVWPDGLSQVINLKTIKTNLPSSIFFGIRVITNNNKIEDGNKVYFDEPAENLFNTNFTVFIQEVTTTLQSPILNR
jgi:hypothetical protein